MIKHIFYLTQYEIEFILKNAKITFQRIKKTEGILLLLLYYGNDKISAKQAENLFKECKN